MNKNYEKIVSLVCDTLVKAGSTFREDKKEAYKRVMASEDNEKAKWVLETVLANAEVAERNHSPLCDDTGIPHMVLEIGQDVSVALPDMFAEGRHRRAIRQKKCHAADACRMECPSFCVFLSRASLLPRVLLPLPPSVPLR